MEKMVLDMTFVVYPGNEFQLDYMLFRFRAQMFTRNFHVITTEYYFQDNIKYYKNVVKKYVPVEVKDEADCSA